jgi:ASTRA-associated protein 1
VSGDKTVKTGMVMAVSIFYNGADLTVVVGFESGHTSVSQLVGGQAWQILYRSQPHSQPILSLAVDPNHISYVTSSADAIIAKHPIPSISLEVSVSSPTNPLSVGESKILTSGTSLLSQGLASAGPQKNRATYPPKIDTQTKPLKVVQTKHSGQQGLKIRSDGKIFATAGWDSRVRVYSLRSLAELAVLKWHKEGCYAVAFADITSSGDDLGKAEGQKPTDEEEAVTTITGAILSVKEKRDLRATTTHWLAAGSKDGKVSLWDIY